MQGSRAKKYYSIQGKFIGLCNTKDREQPETDWTGQGHAHACSTSKKKGSPMV